MSMDMLSYLLLLLLYFLHLSMSQKAPDIHAINGGMILLNCNLPSSPQNPVVWFRPKISLVGLSRDYNITGPASMQLSRRMRIISDEKGVARNMLIRYVKYPEDAGEWSCRTDDWHVESTNLIILVSPKVKEPSINPPTLNRLTPNTSVYTFSCTAHYALPPVQLQWLKKLGPEVSYDITPPRYLQSISQQTLSVSATIILSAKNAGSQFLCVATHPTFQGKSYSAPLFFVLSPDAVAAKTGAVKAAAGTNDGAAVASNQPATPSVAALDTLDKIIILLITAITAAEFIFCLILHKQRRRWQLDVRLKPQPQCTSSNDPTPHSGLDRRGERKLFQEGGEATTKLNGDTINHNHKNDGDLQQLPRDQKSEVKQNQQLHLHDEQHQQLLQQPRQQQLLGESMTVSENCSNNSLGFTWRRERRRCLTKISVSVVLLHLLLLSLVFSFPFYYKGVTIPQTGTDEIAGVVAGSALWLDCRQFVQPITSLVQVTWHKGAELFYYQYYSNGRYIGYPANSTTGFMLGMRASAPRGAGQLCIWPMGPDDGGVFSCHVIMSGGRDHRKTISVFVSMGPMVNYALVSTLAVSLISAICLTAILIYHSIVCRRQ